MIIATADERRLAVLFGSAHLFNFLAMVFPSVRSSAPSKTEPPDRFSSVRSVRDGMAGFSFFWKHISYALMLGLVAVKLSLNAHICTSRTSSSAIFVFNEHISRICVYYTTRTYSCARKTNLPAVRERVLFSVRKVKWKCKWPKNAIEWWMFGFWVDSFALHTL